MKATILGSLALVFVGVSGCAATVGVNLLYPVPEDAAEQCEEHCGTIGLGLSAVAIMANNVGCICERTVSNEARGASAAAGAVTAMLQEEERRRRQRQNSN